MISQQLKYQALKNFHQFCLKEMEACIALNNVVRFCTLNAIGIRIMQYQAKMLSNGEEAA